MQQAESCGRQLPRREKLKVAHADLGDRAYPAMALAAALGGIFVLLARGWVTQSRR